VLLGVFCSVISTEPAHRKLKEKLGAKEADEMWSVSITTGELVSWKQPLVTMPVLPSAHTDVLQK